MKVFLILIILIFWSLFSFSQQNNIYFNKLLFPQHGVNNLQKVISIDSSYYFLSGWLDTPYVSNQGIALMSTDLLGNITNHSLWWDTLSSYFTYPGNSMEVSKDTCIYIVAGYSRGNYGIRALLLKVNPTTLDTIWTRTYQHPDTLAAAQLGANIFNSFTAIRQSLDGGFIISGMYNPGCVANADRKAYLLKIDTAGNVEWIHKYPQIGSLYDIELAPDSGYYFPAVYNNTIRAVKADKYGNIQWSVIVNTKQYPHVPLDLEILNANYLYVSSTFTYDATYFKHSVVLAKVDIQNHTKLWEKNYIVFNNFKCQSLHQSMGLDILPSGDLVITGTVEMLNPNNAQELNHKAVIMKVNADGDSLWARWHGHGLFKDDCQIHDVVLTDDGGFLAVGWQWHNNGGLFYQNAWLLKMDSMGCDTAGCNIYDAISKIQIRPKINMKLYPNPTSDYFRISADGVEQLHGLWLSIIDMQGRELKRIKLQNYPSNTSIDVSNLSSGIYGVSLYSDEVLLGFKTLEIKN